MRRELASSSTFRGEGARKQWKPQIIGTTVPKGCNCETAIYSGLVSYSANTPSVDGLSGDSIRTVADTVNTFSGVRWATSVGRGFVGSASPLAVICVSMNLA